MSDYSSDAGDHSSGDDDERIGSNRGLGSKQKRKSDFDLVSDEEDYDHEYQSKRGNSYAENEDEDDDVEFISLKSKSSSKVSYKSKEKKSNKMMSFVPTKKQQTIIPDKVKQVPIEKTNEDFRKLVEQPIIEEVKIQPLRSTKKLSEISKDLGSWEKHTKGIGAKILNKFGFTGRLGAQGDGVSQAIEVSVRPVGVGLGFGGIKESSTLLINKQIESEWRGIDVVTPAASDKIESWKKGKESQRKVKKLTALELLMSQAMNNTNEIEIIDMTSKKTTVTNQQDVFKDVQVAKPLLGEELLFNMNTLVEIEESEMKVLSKKLHVLLQRSHSLQEEVTSLQLKITFDTSRMNRLERMMEIINRIQSTMEETSSRASITIKDICNVFISLYTNFQEEFNLFGILNLLPVFATTMLTSTLTSWQPFENPLYILEYLNEWKTLETEFSTINHLLSQQVHEMIQHVLQTHTLPIIRRVLVSQWIVDVNNIACITLLHTCKTCFDVSAYEELIQQSIVPKLQLVITQYTSSNPNTSLTLHNVIIPWIPILSNHVNILFPEIRRKINTTLHNWDGISELGLQLVSPWKGYFDETSYLNLLFRIIIPKLIHALRRMIINPQNQDISIITSILSWHTFIPKQNLCALLAGEFFTNWLNVLYNWLNSSPDFEEVSEWYSGWKSIFPQDIYEDELIKYQFNLALDMMESSLSETELSHPYQGRTGSQANSYVAIMERINLETKTQTRLAELRKGSSTIHSRGSTMASFKEVVESFAQSHGIEFRPQEKKKAVLHDKQVWSFGTSSIYLDQSVVFVHETVSKTWVPVSLDELLVLSSTSTTV